MSNLIFSGQLSKEEAIKQLEEPIYPIELFENDLTFVLKKLNLTLAQFELYLQTPARSHSEFNLSSSLFDEYPLLKPYKKLYKKFKEKNQKSSNSLFTLCSVNFVCILRGVSC